MIAQEAAGIYSYLPLGWRVLRKIENIIREEMDKAGGQELMLPVLQPFEPVSYTHLRAHVTSLPLVCRFLLEKKND